ncbi:hypothetical protein GIS00_15895 [Nakamurella sp. YIM 132087]|uniref:Uncharacterized protein n=1 Tax=Nakamurella alba TaxID=2665158 RepID=A0A7K1FMV8_9ACTN|nr:hypothetical protein [Nakamurella alba]MTD15420.1 hypothetical protein [Nakamurella alba]
MTDRRRLLVAASQVLDGTVAVGARSGRIGAVLVRVAFESWLDERSAPWALRAERRPSVASQLVVLRALHGAEQADEAERCWDALSRMCHHHAYELQPQVTEVQAIARRVAVLVGL